MSTATKVGLVFRFGDPRREPRGDVGCWQSVGYFVPAIRPEALRPSDHWGEPAKCCGGFLLICSSAKDRTKLGYRKPRFGMVQKAVFAFMETVRSL